MGLSGGGEREKNWEQLLSSLSNKKKRKEIMLNLKKERE